MRIVSGDILTYPSNYIVHQCNCVTTSSAGLAASIFKKWPEANTYQRGSRGRQPGRIDTIRPGKVPSGSVKIQSMRNSVDDLWIINLYGQYYPNGPSAYETKQQRLLWFREGCSQLADFVETNKTVTLPYLIGCGLAKGSWNDYLDAISTFEKEVEGKGKNIDLVIVRLD